MPNAKMKQGTQAPSAIAQDAKVLNLIPPSKIKKEPLSPQKPASPSKSTPNSTPPKLTNGTLLPSKTSNLSQLSSKPGNLSNGTDGVSISGSEAFQVSPVQEDVKPKISRLASLNAIAKVHVLMERTIRHKPSVPSQAAPLNNITVEALDMKPNIELLRSHLNEVKAASASAASEGKVKTPHPAAPSKKVISKNIIKIKNNLRPTAAVPKNVNLAKKVAKKSVSVSAKKLSQRVMNKLKLPKLIQVKKEKDPIPSTSTSPKSKPQANKSSAGPKEKKKKLPICPQPVKKAKSGGPLEAASKRMASINAKAILALNSHKDTASKTKKKILKQITSRAKLKKQKAALASTADKTKTKKRKLSTQNVSAPPAKKQNKEATTVTTSPPLRKPKKRLYRRKSVQTTSQATKSSPTYCYPHFQSPVHYSTSPIIFHGYDYNTAPAIMDNYPAAPPPPTLGMVDSVNIGTFGSCCRGCPAADPLLHPIHEVCVLSSHSCHHCAPCGAHHHHCRSNFSPAFHTAAAQKVESTEQWQQTLTPQELSKMVKKYQNNLLPNHKTSSKKLEVAAAPVAGTKPEEQVAKNKKDLRVKCSKMRASTAVAGQAEKPSSDEAQVSSSTDVQLSIMSEILPPQVPPQVKKLSPAKCHGWSWVGEPYEKLVYKSNDEAPTLKLCYSAIHHTEGDTIREGDSVLLRSGQRRADLPFVAKITAFWESEEGDMMMSLLWYYRPEHTDRGRRHLHMEDEIFASKHKDINGVGCIEDKCYVLTFTEYCRYRKEVRRLQEGSQPSQVLVPESDDGYPRKSKLPAAGVVSPETVLFCRQVYDFRQKRLLKNPS